MGKLSDKIRELEQKINKLESKILDLTNETEASRAKPESIVPQINLSKQIPLSSLGTGLGKFPGAQGNIIFNDAETQKISYGTQPPTPTKGFNKHSHSKFSGGALDINTLELVEFDFSLGQNKHCQSYWKDLPKIKTDNKGTEKIGGIGSNLVWDEESDSWKFYAVYADEEE